MPRVSGRSSVEGVLLDWSIDQPAAPATLPVALLSKEQIAAELARVQARRAMDTGYEAELILGLAEHSPDRFDPPPGSPGARAGDWSGGSELPGVSEFFPAELAVVLNAGRGTARFRAARAWTWRESLPATFAALRAGRIDERRAGVLAEVLAHTAPEIARQVEARLLDQATDLSLYRLREAATELLLTLDADAADERRAQATPAADVFLQPGPDGMATLGADLPADEAAEAYSVIDQLARMAKADGDDRPIAQLRTELYSLLLRRPGGHAQPAATTHLTITATLDSLTGTTTSAGSVNGLPITAAHARELLARIGALDLTTPEGGSLTLAITGPDGRLLTTTTVAELLRVAKNGCSEHPAGSDGGDCGCPVLGPPPATDAYPPTDRQRVFVKTRDRTCRMPNCGQRVGWADLDHVVPHACDGDTTCTNLCCLCRSDHRLKTFAPGWQFAMDPDGTLHVTTPSGITRTTRPPGLRPPGTRPPGTRPPDPAPPASQAEPPPPAVPPDGDPPPF